MATPTHTLRPLACWKSILRHTRHQKVATRSLTTYHQNVTYSKFELPPPGAKPQGPKKIKVYPAPAFPPANTKEPLKALCADQIALLDPTGARTSLFSKTNPEAAKVGDILLVRLKGGDPFAGVCINIRRRGVDTGILLRNQLTRVGVEMWYKIYSPNVEGIEVVQRREKRARRARLTYMRKPKHDMGSVQNLVLAYQRSRSGLRGSGQKEEGLKGGKKKSVRGKKH
ncbi:mitochondrial ribosomal protein-like protein [Hyaloscypha variabilis F]|uniref:Mitochondrial ribosomal protein-like protein n=1 Tax=Hyaloscypha variabilis (strain UAMH 11265 / GT02V1 / F) TaxID=1149755 RepID=A0A2J6RG49_HYAVF|nr:mitochondrial ribosomal protein-like protein [Hyaloscypha variabilis F]